MSSTPENKASFDLMTIYYMLFRHKWKILLFIFLGLLAAAGVFALYPKSYQSSAELMVRYVMDSRSFREDMGYEMRTPDERGSSIINNEVAILRSEDLLAEVVEELGPDAILAGPDENESDKGLGRRIVRKIKWKLGLADKRGGPESMANKTIQAIHALKNNFTVESSRSSNIITLNYANPDSAKVVPVLEKVIERYLVRHQALHGASDAYEFLTHQTELLRNRLRKTEEELRKLKAEAEVIDLDEAQRLLAEQVLNVEEQIRATEADLAARTARIAEAEKNLAGTIKQEPDGPAPDPDRLSLYQAGLRQLSDAKLMEMEALSQFKENSAPVKQAQLRVKNLRNNLAELRQKAVNPGLRDLTVQLDTLHDLIFEERSQATALNARMKVLIDQLKNLKAKSEKLDQYTAAIVQMERQKELEESNYRYFSQNLEQARIDKALESGRLTNIGLVQAPSIPRANSTSKLKLVLMVFCAISALGLGLAIALEFFLDQSIRRPVDIEQGLHLPLMLNIPTIRQLGRKKRHTNPLLTGGTPHRERGRENQEFTVAHPLQMYIDALRDRVVMSMSGIRRPRILGITSCGPSTGVTTIAAGLALSLSRSGNGRILLIDANFFNCTDHPFYQQNPSNSLIEVLSGEEARPTKIQHSLYMLSPGEVNGELSRISLAERFNFLMDNLRQANFDYVIVDLPPIDLTSASFRLASLMDQNLLVVESEETTRDEARRALNILNQTEARVSGVVLNRTRKYLPGWIHPDL